MKTLILEKLKVLLAPLATRGVAWLITAILGMVCAWLGVNPPKVVIEVPGPERVIEVPVEPFQPPPDGWDPPTEEQQKANLQVVKAQQNGLDPEFGKIAKAAVEAGVGIEDPILFWEAEQLVLKKILPAWDQGDIGSCVGHGWARAVQDLLLMQILQGKLEQWPGAEVSREWIYGASRVEIGGGRIGGDGSVGSWAAAAVQKYGNVFYLKYPEIDLTSGYSVARCRQWGDRGAPDALEPTGKQRIVKTVALVKTGDEAWAAIGNGYPIALCSNVGYTMSRDSEGFCRRSGSWAHCMEVRARFVHPSKGRSYVIQNSWGDYLKSSNNQIAVKGRADKVTLPSGCFAVTEADLVSMLRQGDSFALSGFVGFPVNKLDWFADARPAAPELDLLAYNRRIFDQQSKEWERDPVPQRMPVGPELLPMPRVVGSSDQFRGTTHMFARREDPEFFLCY